MANTQVQCTRALPHATDAVWDVMRSFDLAWHPFVGRCTVSCDASGAVIRSFDTTGGGHVVEQRTYASETDHVLRYTARSGIADADAYHARVRVDTESTGCRVTWQAEIAADLARATEIADGTRIVFEAGLDALLRDLPNVTDTQSPASDDAELSVATVPTSPRLSYLGTKTRGTTAVIFLHGIGGNASNWSDQLKAFGTRYPVAALDFRGYRDSALGAGQTTVEDHCNDILNLAKHLGAKNVVLVGLSMGAWIATSFAMRHPDMLAGLVLAGGCTGMSEASAKERDAFRASREVPLAQGQTPADFAPAVVDVIAGPEATAELRETLRASMSAIPVATYQDALKCFTNPPETFDFAHITCPVLMITGRHDRLAPPDEIRDVSQRMWSDSVAARSTSDVTFEVLNGAGHVCNLEDPKGFNSALHAFLDRFPITTRMSKSSRADKQQKKRTQILGAALREFCASGFDGASMDRLAKAADVSKPTLYQYFGDKEGLFSAVLDQGRAHITAPLAQSQGSLVDRLWEFSWTYAEFVLREDMLSLARLILGEASRRPEIAKHYHDSGPTRALDGLEEFVSASANAGLLQIDDARRAANDLWSLILSGPRDYYLHHTTERPEDADTLAAIAHGLRIFLKAYAADPAHDLAELAQKVSLKEKAQRGKG
ncbi:MAG: alpha/beta fold hydrolase [Marinovum sp.]|nr:alpha/beta fold hydrolase [Marinovum sp.]